MDTATNRFIHGTDQQSIIARTMNREGGYVWDPDDHGGETNWGVTIKTARNFGYHGPMKSMPRQVAEGIYRAMWHQAGTDAVPEHLRSQYFDTVINSGPKRAQQLLISSNGDAKLFRQNRVQFLRRIAERDPSQRKFLRGWLNRTMEA
jgi:lysozyme family protein